MAEIRKPSFITKQYPPGRSGQDLNTPYSVKPCTVEFIDPPGNESNCGPEQELPPPYIPSTPYPTSTLYPSPTPTSTVTTTSTPYPTLSPTITPSGTTTPTPSGTTTPTPTPTPTPFVPTPSDPTLQIWYDGADTTTYNPSGTNGTNITQWSDKSATAHNAAPVGAASTRPMVTSSIQNGKTALYFDGGDGLAANMSTNLQNLTGSSFIFVGKTLNTSLNQQLTEGAVLTGGNYTSVSGSNLRISGSNGYAVTFAGGNASSDAPLNTNWHIHTVVYDGTQTGNSNRLKHRMDGLQRTLSFTSNVNATGSATVNSLLFGVNDALTNNLNGYIGEVLVYTRTLSATEISNTENYLSTKWNIPLG